MYENTRDNTQEPLNKTTSKKDRIKRALHENVKVAKTHFNKLYKLVTSSNKLWAWLCFGTIALISLITWGMKLVSFNEPYSSTYGLDYYTMFSIVPIIAYSISIAYSIKGSKKSYLYKGLVIAAIIFNLISLGILFLGLIKIVSTIVGCLPLLGVPSTVMTNAWIISDSTALCGGTNGWRFVGLSLMYLVIVLAQIFWVVTGALLIANSRKIEDINAKIDQAEGQMEMAAKGKRHDDDEHVNEYYKRTFEEPFRRHNVTHKHVMNMNMDDFNAHLGFKFNKNIEEGSNMGFNNMPHVIG
jgi:hypothetical protein